MKRNNIFERNFDSTIDDFKNTKEEYEAKLYRNAGITKINLKFTKAKAINLAIAFLVVIFILFLIYFAFFSNRLIKPATSKVSRALHEVRVVRNAIITYDNKKEIIRLPTKIKTLNKQPIYIDIDLSGFKNRKNQYIHLFPYYSDIEVYQDDSKIFEFYSDKSKSIKSGSTSMHIVKLKEIKPNAKLKIKFISSLPLSSQITIKEIFIGSELGIFTYILQKETAAIIFAILIIFFFIASAIWSLVDFIKGRLNLRLVNILFLSFVVGMYFFIPLNIVNLFVGVNTRLHVLEFAMLSIITIPFIKNIEYGSDKKYIKYFQLVYIGVLLNAFTQIILVYLGIIEYKEMLYFTHITLILSTLVPIFLAILSHEDKKRKEEMIVCVLPSALCFIFGVVFYTFTNIDYYYFLWLAIIFYIITNLYFVIKKYVDLYRINIKNEYYKKAALTDHLSGLGSRLAYNQTLIQIDNDKNHLQEIWIFSIDMNGLKIVNDTYGHIKGDDMIRALSLIIKQIADSYEKNTSFRIGGDEFVIFISKKYLERANIFITKLKKTVDLYNATLTDKNFILNYAIGYSAYNKKDDDKVEAAVIRSDHNMYKNKELGRQIKN